MTSPPLAEQLSNWRANSAQKVSSRTDGVLSLQQGDVENEAAREGEISPSAEEPMTAPTFFDDEMSVRFHVAIQEAAEGAADESSEDIAGEPVFEGISVTQEDVALAAEADEMSLMEPEQLEELINPHSADDTASEASQEYGDENAIPIDPALLPMDHSIAVL